MGVLDQVKVALAVLAAGATLTRFPRAQQRVFTAASQDTVAANEGSACTNNRSRSRFFRSFLKDSPLCFDRRAASCWPGPPSRLALGDLLVDRRGDVIHRTDGHALKLAAHASPAVPDITRRRSQPRSRRSECIHRLCRHSGRAERSDSGRPPSRPAGHAPAHSSCGLA
jgi:hypothetical protein